MGQFSVEKPGLPGSVLSGNQHRSVFEAAAEPAVALAFSKITQLLLPKNEGGHILLFELCFDVLFHVYCRQYYQIPTL